MPRLRFDHLARPAGALRDGRGRAVVNRLFVADRPIARLVGLLGTPDPEPGEALVLAPCNWVHGMGLRAPVMAVFIDPAGRVLRVVDPLPRRGARCRRAACVLEAASGTLVVRPGDVLHADAGALFPLGG